MVHLAYLLSCCHYYLHTYTTEPGIIIVIIIIIIIRMLGWRRPIAQIMFAGNVQVPLLADGGCGAVTNLVQSSLPWTSGWSSLASRT